MFKRGKGKYMNSPKSLASSPAALSMLLGGFTPSPKFKKNVIQAATAAVDALMRQKKSRTQTIKQTRTKNSTRYRGAITSQSAGRFKRGSKKYKKKALVKKSNGGINWTLESGKVQTGTNCVWIGHATTARRHHFEIAGGCLLQYFVRVTGGSEVNSWEQPIRIFNASDEIIISHRSSTDSVRSTSTYTVPAGGVTMNLFASWWIDPARAWFNNDNVELLEMYTNAGVSNHTGYLRLIDVKITYTVKSSLKIQNRSKAVSTGAGDATNDETTAVDNVPVYGKSYSGTGNGLIPKKMYELETAAANPIVLTADNVFGTIIGSETDTSMKEPLQGNMFANAKYVGKAHLDPAQIKTSVLQTVHTMYLNTFLKTMQEVNAGGGSSLVNRHQRQIGKFRVFALEKMIDVGSTEPITIAIENNMETSMRMFSKKKYTTVKNFYRTNIV